MTLTSRVGIILVMAFLSHSISAQFNFSFPSLSEARRGHLDVFKIPSLNDYKKFTKGYEKNLALLDRRSEKAYRKSFLKFIAVEDELLYTLCDRNEFRANALMRSASASFGKMESDRSKTLIEKSSTKSQGIQKVVEVSQNLIPELESSGTETAQEKHKKEQHRYGSEKYATYMQKRVGLYKRTFKDGSKKQKRLYRKLRKRAILWQSFKTQDADIMAKFADDHLNIMKSVEATDSYKSMMSSAATDYSGTQLDPASEASSYNKEALFGLLQDNLITDGLLSPEQINGAKNISELFKKVQEVKQTAQDSLQSISETKVEPKKEKPLKINSKSSKRFWDRLYGGVNFDWENSTGYYPDGLGVTFTGGYHISDNSGLNIEAETLLNGSKMGFSEDLRFESTLVSNYSIGANIDYRLWKFFFAGIGSQVIINTIEVPAAQLYDALENTKYTMGIPVMLKAILPIAGGKSTQVQFSYDLNSQSNIKPKFDFKVGLLIGR